MKRTGWFDSKKKYVLLQFCSKTAGKKITFALLQQTCFRQIKKKKKQKKKNAFINPHHFSRVYKERIYLFIFKAERVKKSIWKINKLH